MEWVNKKDHGLHSYRNMILRMLRNVVHATNMEEYNTAVCTLQESDIWKTNNALKQWFSRKWMLEIKVDFVKLFYNNVLKLFV